MTAIDLILANLGIYIIGGIIALVIYVIYLNVQELWWRYEDWRDER